MESTLNAPSCSSILKQQLKDRNPEFWELLRTSTEQSLEFGQLMLLNNLRKRALRGEMQPPYKSAIRIAIVGGASLHPLADLIQHFHFCARQRGRGDLDRRLRQLRIGDISRRKRTLCVCSRHRVLLAVRKALRLHRTVYQFHFRTKVPGRQRCGGDTRLLWSH